MPFGIGFPLGAVLACATTFLVVVSGAASQPVLSVLALAAVIGFIAVTSTISATLATAAVAWCLHAGFVLGRLGDLELSARSAHDALVLGGVGLIASVLTSIASPAVGRRRSRTCYVRDRAGLQAAALRR
ncbi:hypothetical protein [Lentzea sp. NPDC051838]|uniref:hypothetical protein n=1 Tax=Lentzea sp. NPDC051838 TaxID=3154849 RepID=UPI00341BEC97